MTIRHTVLAALLLAASTCAVAQDGSGGLTPQLLSELKASFKGEASDIALMNALCNNPINKLALSHESLANIDTHFSNRVTSKGITDQKRSGRCWMFTGMNVMRADMIRQHGLGAFEFSQAYTFFWDQLEKSNLFLQNVINTAGLADDDQTVQWLFRNPISDGGQFTGISDIIGKYGLVPKEIMPETVSSNDTQAMATLIARRLRESGLDIRAAYADDGKHAAKAMTDIKVATLKDIYRILVLNIGQPPTEFTWTMYDASGKPLSTKVYTPESFFAEYVGDDLTGNYVMFMNDPTREYYRRYEIDMDRHAYDGYNWTYINLPMDDIKAMAIASIKDSTMMYMSCDVGKYLNIDRGTNDVRNYDYESLLGVEFGMDKRERIMSFDSGSTHAMTLVGVDLDSEGKPKKWLVENSWGAASGFEGHLIMTDQWLDEYLFRLVVNKKYIPQDILKLTGLDPIKLPAWDPMFKDEE